MKKKKKKKDGKWPWWWSHLRINIHPVFAFLQQRSIWEQLCKQPRSGWVSVFPQQSQAPRRDPAVRYNQESQFLVLFMCLPGTDSLESGPPKDGTASSWNHTNSLTNSTQVPQTEQTPSHPTSRIIICFQSPCFLFIPAMCKHDFSGCNEIYVQFAIPLCVLNIISWAFSVATQSACF